MSDRGADGNDGVVCLHSDAFSDFLCLALALRGDPSVCRTPATLISGFVLGPSSEGTGQELGG